jgi:hypothetical protein
MEISLGGAAFSAAAVTWTELAWLKKMQQHIKHRKSFIDRRNYTFSDLDSAIGKTTTPNRLYPCNYSSTRLPEHMPDYNLTLNRIAGNLKSNIKKSPSG